MESSGYSLAKDECEDYLDDRVECAWFAYRQAFRRAIEQAVPEGFVLVPKEPTEKMLEAGYQDSLDAKGHEIKDIYRAMIKSQEQSHE